MFLAEWFCSTFIHHRSSLNKMFFTTAKSSWAVWHINQMWLYQTVVTLNLYLVCGVPGVVGMFQLFLLHLGFVNCLDAICCHVAQPCGSSDFLLIEGSLRAERPPSLERRRGLGIRSEEGTQVVSGFRMRNFPKVSWLHRKYQPFAYKGLTESCILILAGRLRNWNCWRQFFFVVSGGRCPLRLLFMLPLLCHVHVM